MRIVPIEGKKLTCRGVLPDGIKTSLDFIAIEDEMHRIVLPYTLAVPFGTS